MNSPVLTAFGVWKYQGPLSVEEVRGLLTEQSYISAIGHEATAAYLSQLLLMDIPANRIQVSLMPGDRAIISRLKNRLPEGQVLNLEQLENIPFELGLLTFEHYLES